MLRLLENRGTFFDGEHYVTTYNPVSGHYATLFTIVSVVILGFRQNFRVTDIFVQLLGNGPFFWIGGQNVTT